jgi:hypothetical protein
MLASVPQAGASYDVYAWAMQAGPPECNLQLLLNAKCQLVDGGTSYPYIQQMVAPGQQWIQLNGTLAVPPGCTSASIYLNQNTTNFPQCGLAPDGGEAPDAGLYPDLYIDDVYIYQQQ